MKTEFATPGRARVPRAAFGVSQTVPLFAETYPISLFFTPQSFEVRQSTFSAHHNLRSERLLWGNQLVAGLGSPLSAMPNSAPQTNPATAGERGASLVCREAKQCAVPAADFWVIAPLKFGEGQMIARTVRSSRLRFVDCNSALSPRANTPDCILAAFQNDKPHSARLAPGPSPKRYNNKPKTSSL